jgi:hypothetical protein
VPSRDRMPQVWRPSAVGAVLQTSPAATAMILMLSVFSWPLMPDGLNGTVGGGMFGFRELHLVPQANENKHRVFVTFQHFNENRQSSRRRIHLRC